MFARCLFLTLFVVVMAVAGKSNDQSKEQTLKLSACAAKLGECDESEGPVCGTDDQTYHTRCHLLRVQCSGHPVSLKYRGSCNGCLEAVQYARRQQARDPKYFVPRCRKDGNYAARQCYGEAGCWCSDSMGRPIEDTSTSSRRRKPKCRAYRRNRRRLPTRQISYDADSTRGSAEASSSGSGTSAHRPCGKADRMAFNTNLIEVFRSEYLRFGPTETHSDAAILDWKYTRLDADGNQLLDRQEVRELKKLLKRAVKPRRCGRAFGKYCDVNKDDNLSRIEWNLCLFKDAHNRSAAVDVPNVSLATAPPRDMHYHIHTTNSNSNNNHDHTNTNIIGSSSPHTYAEDLSVGSEEHDENYDDGSTGYGNGNGEDEDESDTSSMHHSRTSLNYPSLIRQNRLYVNAHILTVLNSKTPESTNTENEGESNCWVDQAVALEEQGHGGKSRFYVPECMPDGRYQRIQCYSSTPYCWCVNEDTGKNIPGTWVKNKPPQCDEDIVVRPMKGCTEPRKTQFLKELKAYLNTQLSLPSSPTSSSNSTMWKTEDERIATLSFVYLDKNKNKSWERREWKVFRDLVTSASNLRRCGKKMPRYCDVNGDKKISLAEWLNCLQSSPRAQSATTAKPSQSNETANPKLLGLNPLEKYLKD
ncbi:SPARC-related modular calcium-binding protein 2 isoform X1 [Drosophila guanche]|uniref:Blast:SPARC-related modular calcium-binding protein 1 n=1 Tax=Drosophila guanche TaxID=7266 RepID=A0A3B0JJI7_DROGU|nr:SPARC-related modular calcium-binding protein 2 isoform X1 [Drosophila guanche]SPP73619.1 blast:SPARC-related modular calcium-binding protein 1 [Drosophila guanche]